MLLNMSDVVTAPEFAQSFVITRSSGQFVSGGYQDQKITVNAYGTIQPATAEVLDQIPEGDRVEGMMMFHTPTPMYTTNNSGVSGGVSDQITWNNQQWRLQHVFIDKDFGFYKALGVRMSGA